MTKLLHLPLKFLPDEGNFIVDGLGNVVAEIPCQGVDTAVGHYIVNTVNAAEWIDPKNKLPEHSLQGVLALVKEGPWLTCWLAYYFRDRKEWRCVHKAYPKKLDVVKWMPLPHWDQP